MKRARKSKDWVPNFHEGSKKWRVTVPAKLSSSKKRYDKYFDSQDSAEKFIGATMAERAEHGKQAVTAEERQWIGYARTELGSLSLLPEVIRHWKRTGSEAVTAITAKAAVEAFVKTKDRVGRRTISDIRYRLNAFGDVFGDRPMHQIHAGEIETFINSYKADWSRASFYKRLRPFFAYGVRHRWLAVDPIETVDKPETPRKRKEIYSAVEFQGLLMHAALLDAELLPFACLAGFGMMRTSELVRLYLSEDVLRWEDIEWDRDRIHVREGVGKATRRAVGNERYIPIIPAFRDWLYRFRQESGYVIPLLHHDFAKRWRAVHGEKVDKFNSKIWYEVATPIHNGLRRSAISHKLAAEPDLGVVQCARWAGSSEATIKGHYLELLSQEDGVAWFVTATDRLKEVNAQVEISDKALKDSNIFVPVRNET